MVFSSPHSIRFLSPKERKNFSSLFIINLIGFLKKITNKTKAGNGKNEGLHESKNCTKK
jgi:hypothetical protein